MCQGLRALRQSITTYAGEFDAGTLTVADAGVVVGLCAQIEASAASIKALAAARLAEGKTWQTDGCRSPSEQLAKHAGMSPAAAKRALETGRRLAKQPEVAAAALAGDLSSEQAAAVSDGAAADPTKAAELIDQAKGGSLTELNEEVAKVKAAKSDKEQRHKDRHTKRSLRRWTDRDGVFHAHLYGQPEDGARLWRMLDPLRRRLNALPRQPDGPIDTLAALDYDALIAIANIANGAQAALALDDLVELGLFPQLQTDRPAGPPDPPPTPPPDADPDLFSTSADAAADPTDADLADADPADAVDPADADPADAVDPPDADSDAATDAAADPADATDVADAAHVDQIGAPPPSKRSRRPKKLAGSPIRVMVRVDLDALLRGVALDGELCEIPGYGEVPVSVVKDLMATENPFIIGILTKAKAVVGVYHHRRHPDTHQRSALDFLYPTCAAQGCSSRDGLQYDHRHDYAHTHYTAFDLLDRLCGHHHRQKTNHGWALVDGHGKRAFVPPDDPRHPRYTQPAPNPPP